MTYDEKIHNSLRMQAVLQQIIDKSYKQENEGDNDSFLLYDLRLEITGLIKFLKTQERFDRLFKEKQV